MKRKLSKPDPTAAARPHPRPHGINAAARERIIASEDEQLPRALRVPPIRCVSEFVLSSLANEDGSIKHNVRTWLESEQNAQLLRDMKRLHITRVGQQWPLSPKTFDDIVRKSLLCYQSTSIKREAWNYSLPRTLQMFTRCERPRALQACARTTTTQKRSQAGGSSSTCSTGW